MHPERIVDGQPPSEEKPSSLGPESVTNETTAIQTTQIQGGPFMGKAQENPVFTKWWRGWASRVRRISARRVLPGHRGRLERREDMRHHNSDTHRARAGSQECEFKRDS